MSTYHPLTRDDVVIEVTSEAPYNVLRWMVIVRWNGLCGNDYVDDSYLEEKDVSIVSAEEFINSAFYAPCLVGALSELNDYIRNTYNTIAPLFTEE